MNPFKKKGGKPPAKKSNAAAMRKCREKIKNDPGAYHKYLEKERERYQKRKAQGKIPNIHKLSEREQRQLRRKWKLNQRKQRSKKFQQLEEDLPSTPPPSPDADEFGEPQPGPSQPSTQKKAGRRKTQARDRKAYRTITKNNAQIKQYQTEIRKLKRKISRMQNAQQLSVNVISDSPASKAYSLLSSGNNNRIRKELTFCYAIKDDLKAKVLASKKRQNERKAIHAAVVGPILQKYRLINKAKDDLQLTRHGITRNVNCKSLLQHSRQTRNYDYSKTVSGHVKKFFLEDINSTPAAGKKDTKTVHKDKRQKRYLNDTLQNLYVKFKAQNPDLKLSYVGFTRRKPFYCVHPDVTGRDTVKCKQHANFELKALKLHNIGLLTSRNPSDLLSAATCSVERHDCMFRNCAVCKKYIKKIYRDGTDDIRQSKEQVLYHEWEKGVETRMTNNGPIDVVVIQKKEKSVTIAKLCDDLEKDLVALMGHQYRIIHQYKELRLVKSRLSADACVLQIDFSENYGCKATTEIQAMHFGGSRRQITLHTAHATLAKEDGTKYIQCYCTISHDCRHNASSVWAHLDPVLSDLRSKGVKVLHVVSDGPTSQYKNKTNLQLMCLLPFSKYHFERVTWNFLETSHGKGPADGIGAAIKRVADRLVASGTDILSCTDLLNNMKRSEVKIIEVNTKDINDVDNIVQNLQGETIQGTMLIHQVIVPRKGVLLHRKLSCFCKTDCECHPPLRRLQVKEPDTETKKIYKPAVTNAEKTKMNKRVGTTQRKKENLALEALEAKLTEKQLQLFQRRLENGYDVVHMDLSILSVTERQEYAYWKSWNALMTKACQQGRGSNGKEPLTESSEESDSDDGVERSDDEQSEWNGSDDETSIACYPDSPPHDVVQDQPATSQSLPPRTLDDRPKIPRTDKTSLRTSQLAKRISQLMSMEHQYLVTENICHLSRSGPSLIRQHSLIMTAWKNLLKSFLSKMKSVPQI
ncbi:uncharacterized protein LOC144087065 isoform X2 [Stigmatopora argus]